MPQPLHATEPEVLTPEDVEVQYQIKRGTQAAMRSRGQIPFLKLGGGRIVRYRRSEIEAWLSARAVAPTAPIEPARRRKLSPETLAKRKASREANRLRRAGVTP